MRQAIKTGVSFGLTSGTITTLGLMIGLYSSTNSRLVVLGGIITIAIADALSDALGMHLSEESRKDTNSKKIWAATVSTFFTKFLYALTFIIPFLFFELATAIKIGVVYGLIVLTLLSDYLAKRKRENRKKAIFEHLGIAILVIVITYFVGEGIALVFG
jgi:VIT1/CCC1 family predicted Fe2+/Mn2+ transporter